MIYRIPALRPDISGALHSLQDVVILAHAVENR
jgi:hypothetical protein